MENRRNGMAGMKCTAEKTKTIEEKKKKKEMQDIEK